MRGGEIDWPAVKRVLVVKLRSIGDTVLSTPSLIALKRYLPHAQIDILLEDWVAPLLDEFDSVDNVLTVGKSMSSRLVTARKIRRNKYDVIFNLHGGTTGTFFCYASGARHRVGYETSRYNYFYTHLLSSATDFWNREKIHSVEHQLALLGFVGVPVDDRPRSRLAVTETACTTLEEKLAKSAFLTPHSAFALLHPAAAFATKQWPTENFARTAEYLADKGLGTVAIVAKHETQVAEQLLAASKVPILALNDLTLPEITALASKAAIFVGNDSGVAHIAAAVQTPSVVIFGSSNRVHWRPWTDAPNEIVYEEFPCQPCPGYTCEVYGEPKCILSIKPEAVFAAIDRILNTMSL